MISFTAQRSNYREFPEVARLGRQLKINRVWADRLIPEGQAQHGAGHLVSFDQFARQHPQFLGRKSQSDFQKIRAPRQPFQVLRPAEWLAVVNRDSFEHAVPIKEASVGDRHHRLFLGNELTIEQDKHNS